jgi:hypothetical protein
MDDANPASVVWSAELASDLLRSLPEDAIDGLLGPHAAGWHASQAGEKAERERHQQLIARSLDEAVLQRAIQQAWRQQHFDLVAAAQFISIDGPAEQCESLLSQFAADEILLELITDDQVDGWALAQWTVENVQSELLRRELGELLRRWSGETDRLTKPTQVVTRRRIVIFGGHQRDESKMNRRLFEDSLFDVRWKPCEKTQGKPNDKDLIDAMAHADAVILVTSMVSHNIMGTVKRYTGENNIPLRMVGKATDLQLRNVLEELYPEEKRCQEPF